MNGKPYLAFGSQFFTLLNRSWKKEKTSNFTVDKPVKQNFNQVMKININSDKACKYYVPLDQMK